MPFTLAVLSVPVFDTLRVMSSRILRHTSPFHPDKTHLHHLFIELGFSHAGTTFSILTLNALVVLFQWLLYLLGASVDGQLYGVVALSLLFTFGFYHGVKNASPSTFVRRFLSRLGGMSHIERRGIFLSIRNLVDRL